MKAFGENVGQPSVCALSGADEQKRKWRMKEREFPSRWDKFSFGGRRTRVSSCGTTMSLVELLAYFYGG